MSGQVDFDHQRSPFGARPAARQEVGPAFYTVKVFAYYGASLKQAGEWEQHPHSLVGQPDPSDRRALLEEARSYVPASLGPSGWVGVDLDTDTDWTEIAELLDASYRLTAPKRAIARLDAPR